MNYYVVKYKGIFGFIRPYISTRDDFIHTQQFLSPGTIMGISKRLFGDSNDMSILRHKLNYDSLIQAQECVQSVNLNISKKKGIYTANTTGVIIRLVMYNPILHLAFSSEEKAQIAMRNDLCLIRNEDLVFPYYEHGIKQMTDEEFSSLIGYELLYDVNTPNIKRGGDILVGRTKYMEGMPMCYGKLDINV